MKTKANTKARVLVTDDSAFMRRAIRQMLEEEPDIEVVAVAHDGKMALEYAKQHQPDVITLDIEMPVMDGLTALRHIMRQNPTQVLMISSLTTEGSVASLQALRMGAADVIAKEHSTCAANILEIKEHLVKRVRALAKARKPVTDQPAAATPAHLIPQLSVGDYRLLAIGSSTGGPAALEKILPKLPANFPMPVVVAQHMPLVFTTSMSQRLDQVCAMKVVHAEHGTPILPGQIHIAPGGTHLHLTQRAGRVFATLNDEPTSEVYKPSVSVLFDTCANIYSKQTLGVVLTGIGDDGLSGAKALHDKGATLIAQDEASSVVYGMPRAIADAGIATAQLNPEAIATMLGNMVGRQAA